MSQPTTEYVPFDKPDDWLPVGYVPQPDDPGPIEPHEGVDHLPEVKD